MSNPRVVIVTGAAQGLGRAVARRAAADGATVALWDVLDESGEDSAELCREAGAEARFWHVDVGDEARVVAAFAEVEAAWGTPAALVNNAGIYPRHSALDISLAEWEQVLRVNLTGTFLCARTAAKAMIATGEGGRIVNTASGRALQGAADGSHYASSKGGIISLTKSLAVQWARHNILVNCVIPGIADTAQPRGGMSDNELYAMGEHIPLGRIATPEDIAGVVSFLLGPDSAYMTGQSVAVNGGAIMIP